MTTAQAHREGSSAVFELIEPFAEAPDPRLRGNAVYALAALVNVRKGSLGERAKNEIVRIVTAEAGGDSMDWQRRFAARALDALHHLPEADQKWIGDRILDFFANTRVQTQRAAIARFMLSALERAQGLWKASWLRYMRLARLMGRPNFGRCLWSAAWRYALVWLSVVAVLASLAPRFSDITSYISEPYLSIGVLSLLTRFSLSGRLRAPLRIRLADIAVCGGFFAALAAAGSVIILGHETELSAAALSTFPRLIEAAGLGFVVGVLVRSLRWVAVSAEVAPADTAEILRPLGALVAATGVCIGSTYLGVDYDIASAAWLVLAPTSAVAASLDLWLEKQEPQPLITTEARKDRQWAVPVSAALLGLVVGFAILRNWTGYVDLAAAGTQGTVQLPEVLGQEGSKTLPVRLGSIVPIIVTEERQYNITGKYGDQDTVLVINEWTGKKIAEKDPPTFVGVLKPGSYQAQVRLYSSSSDRHDVFDFAARAVMAKPRTGPSPQPPQGTLTISLENSQ